MKNTELDKQIEFYKDRLKTLKTNQAKQYDELNDSQKDQYDVLITANTGFIRALNKIKECQN